MSIKFLQLLRNSKGLSLTEVMIGGAILAGVALGSAQLFRDQKVSQKKIEHEQKLMMYHHQLTKFMTISSNCNTTMKNVLLTPGVIPNNLAIPSIYKCENKCADENDQTDLSFDAYTPLAYDGSPYITTGDYIDGSKTWRVENMQILLGRSRSGAVTLKVTYRMNPEIYEKTVSKDITFNVRFYGNEFRECRNNLEGSINNLQNDMCKSLNFSENDGSETGFEMAEWDEATQTCKIKDSPICTAKGMMMEGVNSDGSVRCKPIMRPEDAADLEDGSSSATCGPGQRPTFYYDPTGKIRVNCI